MPERNTVQIVDQLKAITGGDPIQINPKNQPQYTYRLKGKIWTASNSAQVYPDSSNAINRRQLPLLFVKSFDGRDGNEKPDVELEHRLAAEYSGILNWALEGLKRLYQSNGQFSWPESSEALLAEAMNQSSPLREFFRECCEIDTTSCVRSRALYQAYRKWDADGLVSERDFYDELLPASGHRLERARMASTRDREVAGRTLQRTPHDTGGRSRVYLNVRIQE